MTAKKLFVILIIPLVVAAIITIGIAEKDWTVGVVAGSTLFAMFSLAAITALYFNAGAVKKILKTIGCFLSGLLLIAILSVPARWAYFNMRYRIITFHEKPWRYDTWSNKIMPIWEMDIEMPKEERRSIFGNMPVK